MATTPTANPEPTADPQAVVRGPAYRFTVLTSQLIRMEWNADGAFVDRPTQLVVNRRFDVPGFRVAETDTSLDIWTDHLHLSYDKRAFSPAGLSVTLRQRAQTLTTWHFGDPPFTHPVLVGNLGGTARTLDEVDGACPLSPGILATHGFAVVEDSDSVVLTDDGWIAARGGGGAVVGPSHDLYFFGYGRDYRAALRDFFALTGPTPLVPRFVLGNWWSRYHRYTAEEYLALMDRFAAEGIPLSVAVLDMDWHLVDIDPALGSGWTGYTWNTDLFPDPPAFLRALHERHLAVTLNVHPADGVRRHEAAFADMSRDLGRDPADGVEIPFDITSREFVAAYFARLHHPLEADGVDFWWLDWQQGAITKIAGLDPLWMLNHLHFHDSGRAGRRPLTFSRYAGLGSHRYPVGFSGDSVVSWASLDFQPYFTATAANVGYYWWSHDVGGHFHGAKDDELAARWVQLGAFSPVNRLHSTHSPFNSKEPWRFGVRAERVMARFLRLRHLLVPYLYTAAWAAHVDGVGVVRPIYHDFPDAPEAYTVPNEFAFGPDLLVAPITTPADPRTHLGSVRAWLPPGTWYDAFTGRRYDADDGGRHLVLHRPLEEMPVLARAGAVVVLAGDLMADASTTPDSLVLRVFPGASGSAVVHEDDDGVPTLAERQETAIALTWSERWDGAADAVLAIAPPTGPGARTRRRLAVDLVGVGSVESATLVVGGRAVDAPVSAPGWDDRSARVPLRPGLAVDLGEVDLAAGAVLRLGGVRLRGEDRVGAAFALLDAAEIEYVAKERAFEAVRTLSGPALLGALHALDLPGNLYGALLEIATAS